jgi:four helix bundle protein
MRSYDIHERIFNFVVSVIAFLNKLPRTPTNLIFINQSTRSVTSMGANDQEADGSQTTNDFLHCYTIVRKEGKETIFWIRIIGKTSSESIAKEADELVKEGSEIVAIVSTIMKNTSSNRRTK